MVFHLICRDKGQGQLLIIFMIILMVSVCRGDQKKNSKYSQEANSKADPLEDNKNQNGTSTGMEIQEERPFRMQKVNLLWNKGKKILSGVKLNDLYADLKVHDKHESHLKKLRVQNMDEDGSMEAKVHANYRRIVQLYNLDEMGGLYSSNEIPKDAGTSGTEFQDARLQRMWSKAQQAGFSEKDLETLREEFWHQQIKINEQDFVAREQPMIQDSEENAIDPEPNTPRQESTKTFKNISEGYLRLEHLVASLPSQEPTFSDDRVQNLWMLAKETNWNEEELRGFQEELHHFEHRLQKQAYYKQQLDISASSPEQASEHRLKHLDEKHTHLNQKIKKLYTHFKTRLDRAHSEL